LSAHGFGGSDNLCQTSIAIPASQLGTAWDGRQMHCATEWTKYIHMYIYICTCTPIYIYIYTHISPFTPSYLYIYTHISPSLPLSWAPRGTGDTRKAPPSGINIDIDMYIHICIYMYIHICICTPVYIYIYTHIHTYIAIPASQLGAAWDGRQTHGTTEWTKYIHMYIYMYMHTYLCIHIHTYIAIHTYLYIHIHTHIAIPASQLGAAWDGRQMHGTTEWTK